MPENRPNPEKLLQRVKEEERQEKLGKLKIYLGAAPGVGKTYAMLQDALAQHAKGLDVVIGIVESHGRQEIDSLVKKLEIIPRQTIQYHNKNLTEFDLEAVLKRNPALVLIDEMAHTNAPDLRHTKRWQDIKEILDRGINVFTTLNVQHIESLNDVVSQIIHTPVKETVPDSVLELAETIELIDLPPEDLLKRLQDGKVYFPAQAALAKERFFRKGNLIALRELALRLTAERVNAQVLLYRQGLGIQHIWPTKEKLLVCVGHGTESAKLIRAARRLATSLQAAWIVIHIDTPALSLTDEQRNSALRNLRLAEQLGADTRTLIGLDLVKEIMSFAREQNITKIIVGKWIRSRWKNLFFKSLADEIVRHSGEIDVYIITGGKPSNLKTSPRQSQKRDIPWKTYVVAIGIVTVATIINFLLMPFLNESNFIMIYLLSITIVALSGRAGPSIFASVLSVIAYAYFFSPPFEVGKASLQYFITLFVMLLVAQTISHLTVVTKRQVRLAKLAEQRTATLHSLSRQLASTRGVDKILDTALHYLADVFDSGVSILLSENNRLVVKAAYRMETNISAKELGVAQWVFDLGQMAGRNTDTLPFSDAIYLPLLATQGAIGVLRMRPNEHDHLYLLEQLQLLEACTNQIALAIEVDRFEGKSNKS